MNRNGVRAGYVPNPNNGGKMEAVGYMARLKHCISPVCGGRLKQHISAAVENPFDGRAPWAFPVWEGTNVTAEEERKLREMNVLILKDGTVDDSRHRPRLPLTKRFSLWGAYRNRGKARAGAGGMGGPSGGDGKRKSATSGEALDSRPLERYQRKLRYVSTVISKKRMEEALKGAATQMEGLNDTKTTGYWSF
jgi:hypothetical protein